MMIPKQHRHHKLLIYLMAIELPLVVIVLTFTGIASHNRYQTALWQDGYDNGFNSSPDEVIYAAANYRPFTTPMVWSSFITQYNLVLGVLSVFLLITKAPVHLLRLFYPFFATFIHVSCFVLYIVSAQYQAGSDMSDPTHPQPGPPWYITKNCKVAKHKGNIGYCEQAKSLFAFTVILIVLYFVEFVICLHSCWITPEEREEVNERREEEREFKEYEDMVLKSPSMIPMTPAPHTGGFPGTTPRTLAFNRLDGGSDTSDLPLRGDPGSPHLPVQPQAVEDTASGNQAQPQMYFPPPPKKAAKK